jgi:hypothetical protein
MDWEYAIRRPCTRILTDHVSPELSPNIERENMTWVRASGRTESEVTALNDYELSFAVGGVNQHIFSASVLRNMLNVQTPNTTSGENTEKVTAFLVTPLNNEGTPASGEETTLQKVVRFFQPYVIATSKVGDAYAATIGYNGSAISGLFGGSNFGQVDFHTAATVQTELRMPFSQLFCMPGCHGRTCGVFAVFDTDCSSYARATKDRRYGVNRVRYVVAPTRDPEVVHSYERTRDLQESIKDDTKHYTYEIAIRRIASIQTYGDTSLVKSDVDTASVPEYHVDFSSFWYYRCYMVCLGSTE